MSKEELREEIALGVAYLDERSPGWWKRIDSEVLDMCDPLMHVLALAYGCLVYETNEFAFWSRGELVNHGFMPLRGKEYFATLTNEWRERVAELRSERA